MPSCLPLVVMPAVVVELFLAAEPVDLLRIMADRAAFCAVVVAAALLRTATPETGLAAGVAAVTVTVAVGMVAPAASAVAAALDRAPGHPDPALVVPSVETVATAEVAVVARSAAPFLTTAAASRSTTVRFTIIP